VVVRGEAEVAVGLGEADGELLHPAIPMARPTSTAVIEYEPRTRRLCFTNSSLAQVWPDRGPDRRLVGALSHAEFPTA
jgi:hypothetical protein